MKINLKMLLAIALVVIVAVWAVDSVRSRSYSGTDLAIATGNGTVTVTNPTEVAVPVQFTSTGTRGFSVTSPTEGLDGSSTRQGSGRTATQLLELALPPGQSVITVVSSNLVTLVTPPATSIDVTVQPLTDNEMRTTLIAAGVIILGALFYASHTTGHQLVKSFLPQKAETPTVPVVPAVVAAVNAQGSPMRAYGDNREDISEK